jgi:hypothetical protein
MEDGDAIREEAVIVLTGFNHTESQTSYSKSVVFLSAPFLCPGSVALYDVSLSVYNLYNIFIFHATAHRGTGSGPSLRLNGLVSARMLFKAVLYLVVCC